MSNYRKAESETTLRFPSIKDVAADLASIKSGMDTSDGDWDVRLQVDEDGSWSIHTGDSQFDTDHRGYWGSSYLTRRSNCRELAKELIADAENHYYSSR